MDTGGQEHDCNRRGFQDRTHADTGGAVRDGSGLLGDCCPRRQDWEIQDPTPGILLHDRLHAGPCYPL